MARLEKAYSGGVWLAMLLDGNVVPELCKPTHAGGNSQIFSACSLDSHLGAFEEILRGQRKRCC